MSRILRRPMFRGGGTVNSYGTGITAPLVPGYMGGGQIGGGIVYGKPMADGRFGFEKPIIPNLTMPNNILTNVEKSLGTGTGITTGSELLRAANQKLRGDNAYTLPPGVAMKETETTTETEEAQPVGDIDIGDAANLFGEKDTTKEITLPDGSTKQVLDTQEGLSLDAKAALNLISATEYAKLKKAEENKGKGRVFEGDEEMIGDPREYKTAQEIEEIGTDTGTGTDTGEGEETTQLSAKDAIAENQKLFAELLGSDKARGQDIGDMLLRFSGSGGNTLGEKFQNYVRAESAAGPSRSEKIKQTAAGLAINDYVAGKRAKEQGELLTKKIDYELDAKNKYLTPQADDSNADILRKISTAYKIEPTSNKAIKALLKFRTGRSDIFAITKDPTKIKPKDLEIGINIVTHKGAKTIIEKISETETKVLPFSGI